jgi:hypothetical protein
MIQKISRLLLKRSVDVGFIACCDIGPWHMKSASLCLIEPMVYGHGAQIKSSQKLYDKHLKISVFLRVFTNGLASQGESQYRCRKARQAACLIEQHFITTDGTGR